MDIRHTPPLSVNGSREVIEEMSRPPADTPERRATWKRIRELADVIEDAIHSTRAVPDK